MRSMASGGMVSRSSASLGEEVGAGAVLFSRQGILPSARKFVIGSPRSRAGVGSDTTVQRKAFTSSLSARAVNTCVPSGRSAARDGDRHFEQRLKVLPHVELAFLAADVRRDVAVAWLDRADEFCRTLARRNYIRCSRLLVCVRWAGLILVGGSLRCLRPSSYRRFCRRLGIARSRLRVALLRAWSGAFACCVRFLLQHTAGVGCADFVALVRNGRKPQLDFL